MVVRKVEDVLRVVPKCAARVECGSMKSVNAAAVKAARFAWSLWEAPRRTGDR